MSKKSNADGSRLWVGPLSWLIACIIAFISFWLGGFLQGTALNIYTVFLYGVLFLAIASLSAAPVFIVVWLIKLLHLPRAWSEAIAGAIIGPLAWLFITKGDLSAARTDAKPEVMVLIFASLALIGAIAGVSYWAVQWLLNRCLDRQNQS